MISTSSVETHVLCSPIILLLNNQFLHMFMFHFKLKKMLPTFFNSFIMIIIAFDHNQHSHFTIVCKNVYRSNDLICTKLFLTLANIYTWY